MSATHEHELTDWGNETLEEHLNGVHNHRRVDLMVMSWEEQKALHEADHREMAPDDDRTPLRVGDLLGGFCGGHFGRDSYSDKRVEAIGNDWVIARDVETGQPHVALFPVGDGWKVDDLVRYYIGGKL